MFNKKYMDNNKASHRDLMDKSASFRGVIIEAMAELDYMITLFISYHFIKDDNEKRDEMHLLILGDERINLNSKADIFQVIAMKHHAVWYNSYKSEYGDLNKDIRHVIKERNIFAHRVIDPHSYTQDIPTDTVRYLKFKNSLKYIDYDQKKLDHLNHVIFNLILFFIGFLNPEID